MTGSGYRTGESHGRAKLTEDAVRTARELYAAGVSATDLANACDVSLPTMYRALIGETWQDAGGPIADVTPRTRKKK